MWLFYILRNPGTIAWFWILSFQQPNINLNKMRTLRRKFIRKSTAFDILPLSFFSCHFCYEGLKLKRRRSTQMRSFAAVLFTRPSISQHGQRPPQFNPVRQHWTLYSQCPIPHPHTNTPQLQLQIHSHRSVRSFKLHLLSIFLSIYSVCVCNAPNVMWCDVMGCLLALPGLHGWTDGAVMCYKRISVHHSR